MAEHYLASHGQDVHLGAGQDRLCSGGLAHLKRVAAQVRYSGRRALNSLATQAVLEQLEAEKAKRAAARVASGEVVVIRGICALGFTEEEASSCLEAMKAAEVARLRAEGEKREIVFDEDTCWAIVTGVPRADESYTPHTNTSGEAPQLPTEDAVDGTPALVASGNATGSEVPPQQPTHIRVVLRNGKDDSDDAGEIAEGVYSVERGILVLEDCDGAHIASQPLAITDDPAAVARRLLRETARANFSRPINYPKLGGIA